MNSLQYRWMGVAAITLLAAFFLYPSVDWYTLPAADRAEREARHERPRWLLNLGLDLKGGSHFLMELDSSKLEKKEDLPDAMARAIEILRNRIDQFGVAEPLIAKQGDRWIVVQLPGITNPDQAKLLLGKTALLEFKMVDDSESAKKIYDAMAQSTEPPFAKDGKLRADIAKVMTQGVQILPDREGRFYVIRSSVPMTGAALTDARVDTTAGVGFPTVNFKLSPEGAKQFDALTAANVGRNLAIVLDGVVYTAPTIKSRISGGSGLIEGNFQMDDARNLAIVLRAGALPAPVNIIEERTVGPSLGEDSIRAGLMACAMGAVFIYGFLIFYYRLSGLVACLSLTLNIFLMLAVMAYVGATLTLPGIAGIVLTMAMSIDANVLTLERIKEELLSGKPVRLAVEAGYAGSSTAIWDSNITLLVAGLLLFQFGTGPIKGFAVTLTVGNVISMFTATVVAHMIHESWLAKSRAHTLSI